MGQFHMAEQAENPGQAKQSALTCVLSETRERRHQLPRCMREHGCTTEEVTRDTTDSHTAVTGDKTQPDLKEPQKSTTEKTAVCCLPLPWMTHKDRVPE